jgi:hypothetical protein
LRHTLSYPWVIRASLVFIIRTRHLVLLVCIPAESRLRLSLPDLPAPLEPLGLSPVAGISNCWMQPLCWYCRP